MTTSKTRKLLLKAGALLAAASLAFTASPAMAQEGPAVNAMPETSNIIITKLDHGADTGKYADGAVQDNLTGTPIGGVEFTIYSVPLGDVEAGTEAWQQEIASFNLEKAQAAITEVKSSVTTDDKGIAEFNGLDWGLYLIRETKTPKNVFAANDFLVAVPQTNPENRTEWLDTIYVYPKGDRVSATKTVQNETAYVTGAKVTWTITADNPQLRSHLNPGVFEPTSEFVISDTLDAKLSTIEDDVKVKAPAGLDKNDDYRVAVDGNTVTVTFTEDGRQKLADAWKNGKSDAKHVVVTIDTVVKESGDITNTAEIKHGGDSFYNTEDGGTPEIRYRDVTVSKKDENQELVNGAKFRVYRTKDAAEKKDDSYLRPKDNTTGEWKTNEKGEFTIQGLRVSDFVNGEAPAKEDEQEYWLVEVEAPEGYQLLAEPISFKVTSDGTNGVEVTNASNSGNGFQLPLTGGTGTAMLTILGIAILGLVLFFARMRRNNESA